MSVLDALDATRICARGSGSLADPAVWARPVPVTTRTKPTPALSPFSWTSLARNPHAILMTGMIGAVLVKDAMLRVVAPA